MKRIFLVEDDKAIAKNLILLLNSEGFIVTHVSTRSEALVEIAKNKFDLALIDISLPDGNGFTICTEIKEKQDIPVIFLTASGDESSVVTGLNMGADDYITKPFRPRELIARIRTALRKSGRFGSTFEICGLYVDTATGVVKKNGNEVFLSALEYRLLLYLIENKNHILSKEQILGKICDSDGKYVDNNTVSVNISRLRTKIEDDVSNPKWIKTVHGIGYIWKE